MHFIVQFILFLVIVFFYLHIRFQLKINNNLEVYEIDYDNNDNLQSLCDVRLPILFEAPPDMTQFAIPHAGGAHARTDVWVRDTRDPTDAPSVKLSWSAANELMRNGGEFYYSIENGDFLEETDLVGDYQKNDHLLRPPLTARADYDVMLGARHATTPLCFHTDNRRFFYVARGQITVKLATWKNEKHLQPTYNWKDFKFISPVDVWAAEPENVRFMEILVPRGKIVYIPAYWFYSIKFTHQEEDDASIVECYSYQTYISLLSIAPKLVMHTFYKTANVIRAPAATAAAEMPAAAPPPAATSVIEAKTPINGVEKVSEIINIPNDTL
jgi:hypothetical protein